jgi:hypothetical protein
MRLLLHKPGKIENPPHANVKMPVENMGQNQKPGAGLMLPEYPDRNLFF